MSGCSLHDLDQTFDYDMMQMLDYTYSERCARVAWAIKLTKTQTTTRKKPLSFILACLLQVD